jgi:hypothetical protein
MTSIPETAVAPQDHKLSADQLREEALAVAPEGHELLIPVERLRSKQIAHAQADLLELFSALPRPEGDEGDEVELDMDDPAKAAEVIRAIGAIGEVLEQYSVDAEAFAEFDRGPSARQKLTDLASWYLARLGE